MTTAIEFEHVSKRYRLGEQGMGALSHDLHRAWARLRHQPDPFAKVGQINDRRIRSTDDGADADYVWALKDIDLSVEKGEVLGIIGANGAGKSTLLKLLSRITLPTTGEIRARGRIASLLEVGTGFHPELTGRENIYLNGTILGMRRREIADQLDAIIDFSGCEKYIDTPVKRYSSGMTVRLGFSVAAHLPCEVLVVDEVLAVGDAEFQQKCTGKLKALSKSDGRTVLFVSHNMNAIGSICDTAAVIHHGQIKNRGEVSQMIDHYISHCASSIQGDQSRPLVSANGALSISKVTIEPAQQKTPTSLACGDAFEITVHGTSRDQTLPPTIAIGINDKLGHRVTTLRTNHTRPTENSVGKIRGPFQVRFFVSDLNLVPGRYGVRVYVAPLEGEVLSDDQFCTFDVVGYGKMEHVISHGAGAIICDSPWEVACDLESKIQ